jgi:hypothetical protein
MTATTTSAASVHAARAAMCVRPASAPTVSASHATTTRARVRAAPTHAPTASAPTASARPASTPPDKDHEVRKMCAEITLLSSKVIYSSKLLGVSPQEGGVTFIGSLSSSIAPQIEQVT